MKIGAAAEKNKHETEHTTKEKTHTENETSKTKDHTKKKKQQPRTTTPSNHHLHLWTKNIIALVCTFHFRILGWYKNKNTTFYQKVFGIINFADQRVLLQKLAFARQPGQARPELFAPLLQKSGSCQRGYSITASINLTDLPVSTPTRVPITVDVYFYGSVVSNVQHVFVRNMLSCHSLSIVVAWDVFPFLILRQCEILRKIIVTHWSLVSGWQIFSLKNGMC